MEKAGEMVELGKRCVVQAECLMSDPSAHREAENGSMGPKSHRLGVGQR